MDDTLHEIQRKEQEADKLDELVNSLHAITELYFSAVKGMASETIPVPSLDAIFSKVVTGIGLLRLNVSSLRFEAHKVSYSLRVEAQELEKLLPINSEKSTDPATTGEE
jgi:hypothetical protein